MPAPADFTDAESKLLMVASVMGPRALQAAADRVTAERLDHALDGHPELRALIALSRRAAGETVESISRYPQTGARGERGLFTELHRDALELCCMALSMHLLRPGPEGLKSLAKVLPASGHHLSRWVPRPVLDLPPGTGKTESAKSVMLVSLAMHKAGELPGPYPGVLFLADDVAQLEAVASDLEGRGLVFGTDFGVYHTKPRSRIVEIEQCPELPIVLATVQQLQSRVKKQRQGLRGLKGIDPLVVMASRRKRALVVKDEQLLGIATHYFSPENLQLAHHTLQLNSVTSKNAHFNPLREFMAQVDASIASAIAEGMCPGEVKRVEMPPMDDALALIAKQAADELDQEQTAHSVFGSLNVMGSVSDLGLTIHGRKTSQVICKAVPWWPYEEVPEFVTLDANYRADLMTQSVRKHERASMLEILEAKPEDLKSMHNLRVHVSDGIAGSRGQGGRSDLANQKARASYVDLIVRTAVPIYKRTPRRILVFTFTDSGTVRYRDELKAAFIAAGIPGEAIHYGADGIEPHHRVVLQTWGLHTSSNAFVSCSAVFFLGILRYAPEDMQLTNWGCQQDEVLPLSQLPWSVAALDRSMIVCNVAQAILRAAARATVEGMCPECDAYLILKDPGGSWPAMEREMRKLLGNFTLMPWEKASSRRQRMSQLDEVIVEEVLAQFDEANPPAMVKFAAIKRAVADRIGGAPSESTWSKYRRMADAALIDSGVIVNGAGAAAKGWVKAP